MAEFLLNFLLLLVVISALVAGWMAVFCLSTPLEFARWFSPYYSISRRLAPASAIKLDRLLAQCVAGFSLFYLILTCFLLGGWFATVVFRLWFSPFQLYLEKLSN